MADQAWVHHTSTVTFTVRSTGDPTDPTVLNPGRAESR